MYCLLLCVFLTELYTYVKNSASNKLTSIKQLLICVRFYLTCGILNIVGDFRGVLVFEVIVALRLIYFQFPQTEIKMESTQNKFTILRASQEL